MALKAIRNYDFLRDYFKVNANEIHSSLYRAQVRFSQAFLPSSRSVIAPGMVQLPRITKSGRQEKQVSYLILKTLNGVQCIGTYWQLW